MKRILFTMFLVVASVIACFALSNETAEKARCGPGDQVSVQRSDNVTVSPASSQVQSSQAVTAVTIVDSDLRISGPALLPKSTTEARRPLVSRIIEARHIPYDFRSTAVKEKPKLGDHNGYGHDHLARADV